MLVVPKYPERSRLVVREYTSGGGGNQYAVVYLNPRLRVVSPAQNNLVRWCSLLALVGKNNMYAANRCYNQSNL